MKSGIFVTGTDTNVGKTLVSAALVSALRAQGHRAGYHKPCQTGSDSDSQTVLDLSGLEPGQLSPPVYQFALPAAPSRAARAEQARIELPRLQERWLGLPDGRWVLEGAGGLKVPLNERETIEDLMRSLGLPALLVASTRLGSINHTLLSLAALAQAGIPVRGVVLSGPDDPGLAETLLDFAPQILFIRFAALAELTPAALRRQALECFTPNLLARLFDGLGGEGA